MYLIYDYSFAYIHEIVLIGDMVDLLMCLYIDFLDLLYIYIYVSPVIYLIRFLKENQFLKIIFDSIKSLTHLILKKIGSSSI